MNDKQWVMFFDLMQLIVHLPGFSADEKAERLRQKAVQCGAEANLDEFLGWNHFTSD